MLLKPQLHPQDQINALEAKFENLQPLNLIRDVDWVLGIQIWPQGCISGLKDAYLTSATLIWLQGRWSGSRGTGLAAGMLI